MESDEEQRHSKLRQWLEGALSTHLQSPMGQTEEESACSRSSSYLELIATIRGATNAIEIKRLCIVLVSVLGTVAMHSSRFQHLVHALLSVDWVRCHQGATKESPKTVAHCYVSMLSHLVSQNSCFLPPCFQMLVKSL